MLCSVGMGAGPMVLGTTSNSHAVLMRAGSAARSSASRFNAVRGLRLPFERRRSATSASAASIVNDSTPPDRRCLPPTCTTLIGGGFINAQRGLDDDTIRERDVLGKVVEVLFQSALTDDINPERRTTAEQLKDVVEAIQGDVHNSFNSGLTSLLPTFDLFGYPGLSDPGLVTETSFDVNKLLKDHTRVR